MTTFVCEINPVVAFKYSGAKYCLIKSKGSNVFKEVNLPKSILYNSDRIWRIEDNGAVDFVKNRYSGIMTPVDQKELTIALLSAVCYN